MKIEFRVVRKIEDINTFKKVITKFNSLNRDYFYYKSNTGRYSFLAFDFIAHDISGLNQPIEFLTDLASKNNIMRDDMSFPPHPLAFAFYPFDEVSSDEWSDFNSSILIPKYVIYEFHGKHYLLSSVSDAETTECSDELSLILIEENQSIPELSELSFSVLKEKLSNSKESHLKKLYHAKDLLENSELEKIVLARKIDIENLKEPDWGNVFDRMQNQENAHRFIIQRNSSVFFGSSPELLFAFRNGKVFTEALAGTIDKETTVESLNEKEKTLQNSAKDLQEQNIVSEYIVSKLSQFTANLSFDKIPRARSTNNLLHLRTRILANGITLNQIPDLFRSLFPTPAVCGVPMEISKQKISEIENFERGLYSGAIGWSDSKNGVSFFVPLRCGLYKDGTLSIYSGGGIVSASVPENEFRETVIKALSFLSLLTDEN